jgi:amidophosphoribosyltransferase
MLSRLKPKKIIIASTAPQIRYPDCYGIDMSELQRFVAFDAAVTLLKEQGRENILAEVYEACQKQLQLPPTEQTNVVKKIYDSLSLAGITGKISQLITPSIPHWSGEVEVIFQGIDSLHRALPNHSGDWYFTGNYPTPGGFQVLNKAYVNYYQKQEGRSY